MIKDGYSLFVTKANGTVFRKQAKSASHFVRMCIADERKNGFAVTRSGRYLYEPDFVWDDVRKMWRDTDGSGFRMKLPY